MKATVRWKENMIFIGMPILGFLSKWMRIHTLAEPIAVCARWK